MFRSASSASLLILILGAHGQSMVKTLKPENADHKPPLQQVDSKGVDGQSKVDSSAPSASLIEEQVPPVSKRRLERAPPDVKQVPPHMSHGMARTGKQRVMKEIEMHVQSGGHVSHVEQMARSMIHRNGADNVVGPSGKVVTDVQSNGDIQHLARKRTSETSEIVLNKAESQAKQNGMVAGSGPMETNDQPARSSIMARTGKQSVMMEVMHAQNMAQTACYTHFEEHVIPGNGIATYSDKTVQECKDLCNADSSCVGIDYGTSRDAGGSTTYYLAGSCTTKSAGTPESASTGYLNLDSYTKGSCTACITTGYYNYGTLVPLFVTTDAATCQTECQNNDSCFYFTWRPSDSDCFLHGESAATVWSEESNMRSGPKYCAQGCDDSNRGPCKAGTSTQAFCDNYASDCSAQISAGYCVPGDCMVETTLRAITTVFTTVYIVATP